MEAPHSESLDPLETVHDYFEGAGRLKDGQAWRAVVTYRCKRSHLLSHVLKTPLGYVLYSLRRGKKSGFDEPERMVGMLPDLYGDNGDFAMSMGSCKCQPVRTRSLADIWADVDRRTPGDLRI